ncbi:MAG: chemotaxis protein CheW [Bacteroidia bacterium]
MAERVVSERAPAKGKKIQDEEIFLIVFILGDEEYGIKIQRVKEVTVTPPISKMPRSPEYIRGVANIRGDIVAIMDIEKRFGLQSSLDEEQILKSFTLVIDFDEYPLGIIVPKMPQSLAIPLSKIDRTPGFFRDFNIDQNFIEGIGKVNEQLIIILDINKVVGAKMVKEMF